MLKPYLSVLVIVSAFFISSTSYAAMIPVELDTSSEHAEFYKSLGIMVFPSSQKNAESSKQKSDNADTQETTEIAPVPVPAAAWLFVSGLVGLLTVSRRKKEHTKP